MTYKIVVKQSVYKELERLPEKVQDKIFEKISELSSEPRPFGITKLKEFNLANQPFKDYYRIRVGNYRIIYAIQDAIITITVVKVAHRKEVYG